MPSNRDVILNATREAMRLHRDSGVRAQAESASGRVDVFQTILDLGVPLLFKPLTSLLGVFLPHPSPGILVTTQRNLPIQRFTAAHELGHFILKHSASFDDDSILARSPYTNASYSQSEVAADVFAAEFLIPKWLLLTHVVRQKWSTEAMSNAQRVYQLALRVGTSYTATCRALLRHRLIDAETYSRHIALQPKTIKQAILSGHALNNWYADVWLLGPNDEGTVIQGRPGDVFIIRLRENTGGGYLWNFDELALHSFAVIHDERVIPDPREDIGGNAERVLAAQSESGAEHSGQFEFHESRPWQAHGEVLSHFSFAYTLYTEKGMPRAARTRLVAA